MFIVLSLVSFIEKLQKKPRYVRVQIMWVGTILGAIIIFGFWLWSLSVLLAESSANSRNDKALQSLNEITNEMPGLWQSLSAGISNVINTAKEELNGSPSVTPPANTESQSAVERLPIEQ